MLPESVAPVNRSAVPSRRTRFQQRFVYRRFAGRSPLKEGKQDRLPKFMAGHPCLLGGKLMRLSRLHLTLSVLLFSLVLASPAFANTVNMKYLGGTGSGISGGAVYPYSFSINNSKTPTLLLCDSYDNNIQLNETWTATVSPLLQGISGSLFGPSMTLDYKAAGLIFKGILNHTITATDGQWAIWGLFSTNAQAQSQYTITGAAAIEATYLALAKTDPNSAYTGLLLYTPVAGTQSWGKTPQEFIGYSAVPEPSSLMLMGTGLIGLAGTLRRKLAKG
jgi:hypothetical protein